LNKRIRFLIFALVLLLVVGYFASLLPREEGPRGDALTISVLDVGQGDSVFIELPGGETVLIDAGEGKYADGIISYINSAGYSTLNYVVATHPHADHIGGMAKVLRAFDVVNVYMPKLSHTTVTFEKLLDTIEQKGLTIKTAKAGVVCFESEELRVEFIAPVADSYKNLNNSSAVMLLSYGGRRFVFMGDAETEAERDIMDNTSNLNVDWIKLGHHGSGTSSGDEFLRWLSPSFAVISVGKGNDYHHPAKNTLKKLRDQGIQIWRTDEDGAVVFSCDGYEIFSPD